MKDEENVTETLKTAVVKCVRNGTVVHVTNDAQQNRLKFSRDTKFDLKRIEAVSRQNCKLLRRTP